MEQQAFTDFKSQCRADILAFDNKDIFSDYDGKANLYGCNEVEFCKWLYEQRLFKRFYPDSNPELELTSLPAKKWLFFKKHYTLQVRNHHIWSTYPNGFFEAINEDNKVACLLPEPSGKYPYRVSLYDESGPIYHECFNSRDEALTFMAKGDYNHKENALDSLVGTPKWNRGIYLLKWKGEGIMPMLGYDRDKDKYDDIKQLFSDCINS